MSNAKCQHCGKLAFYGSTDEGIKVRCVRHKLSTDVNMRDRYKCKVRGCVSQANYGIRGTMPQHCQRHSHPEVEIDFGLKGCHYPGCSVKRESYSKFCIGHQDKHIPDEYIEKLRAAGLSERDICAYQKLVTVHYFRKTVQSIKLPSPVHENKKRSRVDILEDEYVPEPSHIIDDKQFVEAELTELLNSPGKEQCIAELASLIGSFGYRICRVKRETTQIQ